jgi:hypothetical protein
MIRTLMVVAAVSLFPLSASADQIKDSIVSQLRSQGFTRIEVSRTLLGRARVTAKSPTLDREIIYNPVTGEILRDYWTERGNGHTGVTLVNPNNPDGNNDNTGGDDGDGNEGDDGGEDEGDDGDDGDGNEGDDGDGDEGDDGGGSGGEGDSGGHGGGDDGGEGND